MNRGAAEGPLAATYPAQVQDYELIARLGRGGMGVVDLARDHKGNRVAMKRLTLHGSASDIMRARQRLLREAQVLRRLHHPNIVRLLDVVEDEDEIVLVMPYMNGGNLAERVTQHGPAPPEEVGRLAQRLLGALATAHAAGIIHRDIKPANVLFDDKGEPCLADFGVAHTWDQTGGLTVAGMVVGTPGFMAPEQARDEQLTPASDVFALGATLLYAGTGVGPFGSGDPGLLMVRAADGKVERIPKTLPAGLRRRLRAMLHPRPERRPTAAALLTGDQSALRRPPARTRMTGSGPAVGFAAFAGVVVLVALGVSVNRDDDDGSNAGARPTTEQDGPPATGGDPSDGTPGPSNEATEDPDDTALVDEAEGVIGAGDDIDSYVLPMDQDPLNGCPAEIRIVLSAAPEVPLRVQVVRSSLDKADETLLADATTQEGEASLVFRPLGCPDPDIEFLALITPILDVEGSAPVSPYRIMRDDS
jgi:serine/threonine protein kinase